jgi:hypothetical protein
VSPNRIKVATENMTFVTATKKAKKKGEVE